MRPREFDDLLEVADGVSLHVPLTGAARLARMKPGAVQPNVARGGVVDDTALASALRESRQGDAALDVYEIEPLAGDAATKFEGMPNLILTPHIGGARGSNTRVSAMIADRVRSHLGRN